MNELKISAINAAKAVAEKLVLKKELTQREKIVAAALDEVGLIEEPINKIKYNDWFYKKPIEGKAFPWCATFVSWIFHNSGYPLGRIDYPNGFCSVPNGHKFWQKKEMLTKTPKPGDIICFEFTKDFSDDHTGIFIEWIEEGKTFHAVEGNTSFDDKGSQSRGGAVALKKRSINLVSAFVDIDKI